MAAILHQPALSHLLGDFLVLQNYHHVPRVIRNLRELARTNENSSFDTT
jgi:hypothetical protein